MGRPLLLASYISLQLHSEIYGYLSLANHYYYHIIIIISVSVIKFYNLWSIFITICFAVRAGTGGDEAGIWAGDLVGTCFYLSFLTHEYV